MTTRRQFSGALAGAATMLGGRGAMGASMQADVVVYGGTAAGLAAAQAASRDGASVIVVEPSKHIGGLVTGGISCTDTGTPQFVGGLSSEFYDAINAENKRLYPNPIQPKIQFRGQSIDWRAHKMWDLEPQTGFRMFDSWVKKAGHPVIRSQRVAAVRKTDGRITSIKLTNGDEISGKVFVDASYEGDLMTRAGVAYTYGRESREEHGEALAGARDAHFKANYSEEYLSKPGIEYTHHGQFSADIPARNAKGELMWGITKEPLAAFGSADKRIQAYCFRLIATQREDIRVAWPKPMKYQATRYELLLKYIQAHPNISFARLVHFSAIPNGKFDLNASGPFSIDYVGGNLEYCDGDYATRDRIWMDHMNYQKGFLWFLAHDARVPKQLRDEVNSWGLCRDEYPDTGHWPVQMYIRESRRMKGEFVMTEADILKNKTKDDSIAMGSFVLDSHWVRRIVDDKGFVRIEGHLDESINLSNNPYEIAWRSLIPKKDQCRNLIVPVCISATHVAICTIRMEPVYMMMGHAAGSAAAMCAKSGASVQDLEATALVKKLRAQGGVMKREQARKVSATPVV